MSVDEAIKELNKIIEEHRGDTEHIHYLADQLLVRVLNSLGYEDLTLKYNSLTKWYA